MEIKKQTHIKSIVLIVLYKSKIMESESVISLLNVNKSNIQLKIIIWNNGPDYLEQEDVNCFKSVCNVNKITFEVYQDVRNISLSHLYNFCIKKSSEFDFFTT